MLKLLHLSAILIYAFGSWYDQNFVEFPLMADAAKRLPLKGRVMYLTIWNLVIGEILVYMYDDARPRTLGHTPLTVFASIPYKSRAWCAVRRGAMRALFHAAGALLFLWGCYYDWRWVAPPGERGLAGAPYGGKLKYLTFLDAILQTVYFTIALLNDFIGTDEYLPARKPLIRKVKDILFSSLAFPLAMFVGFTFWGLYAVDRELVFPKVLDEVFPVWLNHLMHTNIVVFMLIELLVTFRMYPTRKVGISILSVFMLAYVIWLHVVYFKSGQWVYPVLAVLNWPLRVVFYLLSFGVVLSMYVLGEKLNRIMWPKQVAQIVKSGKKKAH